MPLRKHRKWVSLYWDFDPENEDKLKPYLRLLPPGVELEARGFPHGIGIWGFFDTEEQAEAQADRIEALMDECVAHHYETWWTRFRSRLRRARGGK